jgi:hypothetical protein
MTLEEDRLCTLAALLDKVKPSQFVMVWGIPKIPGKGPGCPLGWALTHRRFQSHGLKVYISSEGWPILLFDDHCGLKAAQVFFGLSFDEVWEAFTPSGYRIPEEITPGLVACRIRSLVHKK